MLTSERISAFIGAYDKRNAPLLDQIEQESLQAKVPIIGRDMQSLLSFLLKVKQPMRILEVGTAIGFSALLMKHYAPFEAEITTIEKYEKRIPIAKANFERAGEKEKIYLLEGDATEILASLEGSYDFIFMDAAKGQYLHFLPDVLRLLSAGGILVSDNVLQEGDLMESRYVVSRRNRTIHARMRQYLYELKNHPDLETIILPIGDGATISYRK